MRIFVFDGLGLHLVTPFLKCYQFWLFYVLEPLSKSLFILIYICKKYLFHIFICLLICVGFYFFIKNFGHSGQQLLSSKMNTNNFFRRYCMGNLRRKKVKWIVHNIRDYLIRVKSIKLNLSVCQLGQSIFSNFCWWKKNVKVDLTLKIYSNLFAIGVLICWVISWSIPLQLNAEWIMKFFMGLNSAFLLVTWGPVSMVNSGKVL